MMSTNLIIAITFVPLVLVAVLIGLLVAWIRMRRTQRDDIVDLVDILKEPANSKPTNETDLEARKEAEIEPFPQLPSMNLNDAGGLLDLPNIKPGEKSYGELSRSDLFSSMGPGRTPSNTLTTPPPRCQTTPTESPSSEALAAFDFFETPTKPPVPTRSIKRASRIMTTPPIIVRSETPDTPTPAIKIEPASPFCPSEVEDQIMPLARNLTPPVPSRASSQRSITSIREEEKQKKKKTNLANPMPFSAVPIAHIGSPISDNLPPTPTPTRTSIYGPTGPFMPKDKIGLRAMMANREMMEIEGWRPDRVLVERGRVEREKEAKIAVAAAATTAAAVEKEANNDTDAGRDGEANGGEEEGVRVRQRRRHHHHRGGTSMIGKRNSTIREYLLRNFHDANPWQKVLKRGSRDVGGKEGDLEKGLDVQMKNKKNPELGLESGDGRQVTE